MIIITGLLRLDPAKRDEAIALGCEHSERSRKEPGCLSHDCYLAADDPDRMHFFERWADLAAVRTHFSVPESGNFVRQLSACAVAPPEIAVYAADTLEAPKL